MNTNAGSNSKTNSKSVLIRLSEACNKHKLQHEKTAANSDDDIDNGNDVGVSHRHKTNNEYEKCVHELNILKDIIPKVEAAYRLPYVNKNQKRNNSKASSSNGKKARIGKGSSSSSSSGSNIRVGDIFYLCMFYGNVVLGTFCPFSKQILLQNDKHGMDSKCDSFVHIQFLIAS